MKGVIMNESYEYQSVKKIFRGEESGLECMVP